MDWPRAKTLLIIAFLVADLLLGLRLWSDRRPDQQASRYLEEAGRLEARLEAAGIALMQPLSQRLPALPPLNLTVGEPDLQFLLEEFVRPLDGSETVPRPRGYRGEWGALELGEHGLITWRTTAVGSLAVTGGRSEPLDPFNELTARTAADAFLGATPGWPEDLGFNHTIFDPTQGLYRVYYHQQYKRNPLFQGFVEITVTPRGIQGFQQRRVQVLREAGPAVAVVPAGEALEVVLDRLPPKDGVLVVQEMSLGYYNEDLAASVRAAPAWRVLMADGAAYYIDALTGSVMGDPGETNP